MNRRLIPYAGYDPDETNFEKRETFEVGRLKKPDRIDDEKALMLREQGLSHKCIGELMASAINRAVPYTYDSVSHACARARKKRQGKV